MRKMAFVLALILALSIPLSVQAVEPRAILVLPEITVSATTAKCSVNAIGNNSSEYLKATIRLYRDNLLIGSWYVDGYGSINWETRKTVPLNYTYTLTVDLTVDGVAVPQASAVSQ